MYGNYLGIFMESAMRCLCLHGIEKCFEGVQPWLEGLKDKRDIKKLVTYKYTFKDFPKPFIDDNEVDAAFVFGSGSVRRRFHRYQCGDESIRGLGNAETDDFTFAIKLATKIALEAKKPQYGFSDKDIEEGIQAYIDLTLNGGEKGSEIEKKHNLIVIGSGYCNECMVGLQVVLKNFLPVHFDTITGHPGAIISRVSGEYYLVSEVPHTGMLTMLPNPYNEEKVVLVAAGLWPTGTQAGLMALTEYLDEVKKNNRHDKNIPAKVIEGIDRDKDTRIEDVIIRE